MVRLTSFPEPIDVLVVGAQGGLGGAFVDVLLGSENVRCVHAWSRQGLLLDHPKLQSTAVNTGCEAALQSAAQEIDHLSLAIVATGILHNADGLGPEKSWRAIEPESMAESFRINAILPALIAKVALPLMPRKGKSVFSALSARIGSISDNKLGGWYSYRASKAALNQIIKCLSIELQRTHPEMICVGLHPGTVDTGLSRPFQRSLATNHHMFSPAQSADQLIRVIDRATVQETGSVMAYDGSIVPA